MRKLEKTVLTENTKKKTLVNGVKSLVVSKQFIMFCFVAFISMVNCFAEGETIEQLDTWGDKILSLFGSTWVKVLLLVALIIEAIGVVVAGQQGGGSQIIKKFAPWIIGTIILLCSSGIVSYFLDGMEFKID